MLHTVQYRFANDPHVLYSFISHITHLASTDLTPYRPGLSLSSRCSPMRYFDMIRDQQNRGCPQPSANSAPPTPAAIDIEIANHNGSTVAIEATPDRLQAAKKMPTPSLLQMVEQLTWQNGQLRSEIDYHQRRHAASLYLLQKTRLIVRSLEQVIRDFNTFDNELGVCSRAREVGHVDAVWRHRRLFPLNCKLRATIEQMQGRRTGSQSGTSGIIFELGWYICNTKADTGRADFVA